MLWCLFWCTVGWKAISSYFQSTYSWILFLANQQTFQFLNTADSAQVSEYCSLWIQHGFSNCAVTSCVAVTDRIINYFLVQKYPACCRYSENFLQIKSRVYTLEGNHRVSKVIKVTYLSLAGYNSVPTNNRVFLLCMFMEVKQITWDLKETSI